MAVDMRLDRRYVHSLSIRVFYSKLYWNEEVGVNPHHLDFGTSFVLRM